MVFQRVEEEIEDRIVLVDSVTGNTLLGLLVIAIGLTAWYTFFPFFADSGGGLLDRLFWGGLLFTLGGAFFWCGLDLLLTKESVIIDKRLQNLIIKKDSFIKDLKSIKEIPFSHVNEIEITYHTSSGRYDYDSSANDSSGLWKISLITIDGESVQIYDGDRYSKPKVEKIAEKICRITDTKVTHRTLYDPPEHPP